MKITKRQLRRIIREAKSQRKPISTRAYRRLQFTNRVPVVGDRVFLHKAPTGIIGTVTSVHEDPYVSTVDIEFSNGSTIEMIPRSNIRVITEAAKREDTKKTTEAKLRQIVKEGLDYDPVGDAGVPHVGVRPKYAIAFVDAAHGDRRVELVVKAEDAELAREVMKKWRKQDQVSGVQPTRQRFDPRDVTTREDLMRMLSEAVVVSKLSSRKRMKITKRQLKRVIRESILREAKLNPEQLNKILKQHELWLRFGGKKGQRAVLSGAILNSANLRGANLAKADLNSVHLTGANLAKADLSSADLSGADLDGADLRGADLEGADLEGVDLSGANLTGSILNSPWMADVTVDESHLNWLATDPHFSTWVSNLKVVKQ